MNSLILCATWDTPFENVLMGMAYERHANWDKAAIIKKHLSKSLDFFIRCMRLDVTLAYILKLA